MTADIRDQFISRATRKGYNPAEAAERLDTLLASDPSADERWLGIDELGYGAKLELADRIIRNTYQ